MKKVRGQKFGDSARQRGGLISPADGVCPPLLPHSNHAQSIKARRNHAQSNYARPTPWLQSAFRELLYKDDDQEPA